MGTFLEMMQSASWECAKKEATWSGTAPIAAITRCVSSKHSFLGTAGKNYFIFFKIFLSQKSSQFCFLFFKCSHCVFVWLPVILAQNPCCPRHTDLSLQSDQLYHEQMSHTRLHCPNSESRIDQGQKDKLMTNDANSY